MNPLLRKKMKQIARSLIKDDAMVFRRSRERIGTEWKEVFTLVEVVKAHFYMIETSDSKLQAIENGKESSEPIMKGMFLDDLVKTGDRIIPIIDGVQSDMMLEVMAKPLSPSLKGIHYESPLKMMDIPFAMVERDGMTYLETKG